MTAVPIWTPDFFSCFSSVALLGFIKPLAKMMLMATRPVMHTARGNRYELACSIRKVSIKKTQNRTKQTIRKEFPRLNRCQKLFLSVFILKSFDGDDLFLKILDVHCSSMNPGLFQFSRRLQHLLNGSISFHDGLLGFLG